VQTLVVPGFSSKSVDLTSMNSSTVLVSKLNIPRYDAEINSELRLPSPNYTEQDTSLRKRTIDALDSEEVRRGARALARPGHPRVST
jgi:hypothetical protein